MKVRRALPLLVALLFGAAVSAQTTFNVTLVTKTAAHPYFGMGHPDGFAIDGVEGDELTLERGETYIFQLDNIPSIHPVFISTDAAGAGVGEFSDGVTGNFSSGNDAITFVVPLTAPNELWYQCGNHQFMGYKLNIIDPSSAEDETPSGAFDLTIAYPNPSVERTTIGLSLDQTSDVLVEVFDVTGRRVALLHEGALAAGTSHTFELNDQSLAGGVYVVRATDGDEVVERRITLVR